MAVRSMKFRNPLSLYDTAKFRAKNILGLRFGTKQSGVCVWNIADGTIKPITMGTSLPFVYFDHSRSSMEEISVQLDAIAVEHNAIGYVAGFPDAKDHRLDPMNGKYVKDYILALDDSGKHAGRFISLVSDRHSTDHAEVYLQVSNMGARLSIERQDSELKTWAAVVIIERLQKLAEGGIGSRTFNNRDFRVFNESQMFMNHIGDELGYYEELKLRLKSLWLSKRG